MSETRMSEEVSLPISWPRDGHLVGNARRPRHRKQRRDGGHRRELDHVRSQQQSRILAALNAADEVLVLLSQTIQSLERRLIGGHRLHHQQELPQLLGSSAGSYAQGSVGRPRDPHCPQGGRSV